MRVQLAATLCVAMTVSACATSYTATPMPTAGQTVRYVQGRATTFSEGQNGAVQVTPFGPNEKGRLVFAVAAYNDGDAPVNFGSEDISLSAEGLPVRIFTHAELERMAKNDATTALVVAAIAGGVAAAAASSGPTYRSTTYTPYGTYSTVATNTAAQAIASSVAVATTAATLNNIGSNLDNTLINLSETVLQTTTIDSDHSFGGQVIGDRVKIEPGNPLSTLLTVRFNGEVYDFAFDISAQQ